MAKAQQFVTPKGELTWVFITGEGRLTQDKKSSRFSASLKLKAGSKALKDFEATIKEYWDEHKPTKKSKLKSNGIREEVLTDDEGNETKTGYSLINCWTGVTWPDGKAKVVDVYNAKGVKVDMGDKKIGNESEGFLSGAMGTYDTDGSTGVTLYLNAVQMTKFVEYAGSALLSEEVEEDGWTGEDEETGFEPQADEPKPGLKL